MGLGKLQAAAILTLKNGWEGGISWPFLPHPLTVKTLGWNWSTFWSTWTKKIQLIEDDTSVKQPPLLSSDLLAHHGRVLSDYLLLNLLALKQTWPGVEGGHQISAEILLVWLITKHDTRSYAHKLGLWTWTAYKSHYFQDLAVFKFGF